VKAPCDATGQWAIPARRVLSPDQALLRTLDFRGVIVTGPGDEVGFVG